MASIISFVLTGSVAGGNEQSSDGTLPSALASISSTAPTFEQSFHYDSVMCGWFFRASALSIWKPGRAHDLHGVTATTAGGQSQLLHLLPLASPRLWGLLFWPRLPTEA